MLDNILPCNISSALSKIPYSSLCELRLRAENPVVVNVLGENYYLCSDFLSKSVSDSISIGKGVLQGVIQKLTNYSLYSVNDQLIEGFISFDGGIRVGVCGEIVSIDNKIKRFLQTVFLIFNVPNKEIEKTLDFAKKIDYTTLIKQTKSKLQSFVENKLKEEL